MLTKISCLNNHLYVIIFNAFVSVKFDIFLEFSYMFLYSILVLVGFHNAGVNCSAVVVHLIWLEFASSL